MSFSIKILIWKSYTTNKVLSTIEQVQIVDFKEFVIIILDADTKIFVVYMAIKEPKKIPINFEKQA